jgi:hypothetical protein
MRIAQARCPACRPLAARRNAAAEEFNDLRERHMELTRRGAEGYRQYVDAQGELARIEQLATKGGTPEQVAAQEEAERRRQRQNIGLLTAANAAIDEAKKVEELMKAKAAEVAKLDAELAACDKAPCAPPKTAQPLLPGGSSLLAGIPNIATLIFEAGGLNVSSGNSTVDCPACVRSGSQNVSPSGSHAGVDIRLNPFALFALFGGSVLQPVPITENLILTGPFAGLRVRRYFNYDGDVVAFDFHPAAVDGINDTSLAYEVIRSVKTYIGLGFMLLNPFGAGQIAAIGLAPYVGWNKERGRLRLNTDESSGGGIANNFEKNVTRNGTAFGLDADFYFSNLPFFIGLGLQWDKMPETTIDATTAAAGFAYRGVIPSRTSFTTAVRIGVPIGGGAR